jgi:hypothetical protein
LTSELSFSTREGALDLSEELREQLGLDADESIRILGSGGRTMLLERTRGETVLAVPWDRDLVLTAEVRAFPLADVLSVIHGAAKSGFLYFCLDDHRKSIYMHRGEVVFAASNQIVDRLGECLLRSGKLTLEQLRETERCWSPEDRFGKALVRRGLLTPRGLWSGVKDQVEEIVRSLFAYASGTVHFWEGEVQPDNVVRLSLPTRTLIAEGLRRRDELFKYLASLQDSRVRVLRGEVGGSRLEGNEKALYSVLEVESQFPAACRRAGLDPLSAARTVQLLCLVGAARVVREDQQPQCSGEVDLRKNDEDAVRECVLDHVKLLGELVAPIVAVEGHRPLASRLSEVIEETAQRFPDFLGGVQLERGVVLDPTELTERALRLAGNRERTVCAALGELVAYIEFELKNHPGIEEPEHFLEAVEYLREKIEA